MSAREPSPIRTDMRWTRAETLGVFGAILLFWVALNWPWLSGALTIPWDAKAHFLPQLQFLAGSIARARRRSGTLTSSPAIPRSPIRNR